MAILSNDPKNQYFEVINTSISIQHIRHTRFQQNNALKLKRNFQAYFIANIALAYVQNICREVDAKICNKHGLPTLLKLVTASIKYCLDFCWNQTQALV